LRVCGGRLLGDERVGAEQEEGEAGEVFLHKVVSSCGDESIIRFCVAWR
jgi:hypothetical protein